MHTPSRSTTGDMSAVNVKGKYNFFLGGGNLAKRAGSLVVRAETDDADRTPLVAKLSKDLDVLRTEYAVLYHFREVRGSSSKRFVVSVKDFIEDYDGSGMHALVMERGQTDRGTLAEQFEILDLSSELQKATVAKDIVETANFVAECSIVSSRRACPRSTHRADCLRTCRQS